MSDTVRGTIDVHTRGFGFVEWTEDGSRRSAFVPPPLLREFLHLDSVEAEVVRDKKGLAAKKLTLLDRPRTSLIGEVSKGNAKARKLLPDPEVANRPWSISGSDVADLSPGDLVIADIEGDAVHVRRVVPPDEARLERIRDRYRIRHGFTPELLDSLGSLDARRAIGWRDLRELLTITIDAPHSRDLDDALSVLPADDDGALRVLVHIADVDSVVHRGTAVDEEARRRGTSVYLTGGMSPMLPPVLSEDRLSLVPEQDRRAMTVEMRLDVNGVVTSVDLYPSSIRSNRRLSYREVDAFLSGKEPDLPEDILDALSWLRTAQARIAAVRRARGGITFDRFETHILLDEDLEPVEIHAREQTPAHLLIERLMVAANEAVAQWLTDRGLPGVFRVHPAPDASRVDELEASLERMGYSPGLAAPLSPVAAASLELQLADAGLQPVLQEILAQVLDRAAYTPDVGEHFGLGSTGYLHFTSPLRRYADLTVHRIVKAYLAGERDLDDAGLTELCAHLNDCTARSAKAEASRRRSLTARWANERIGQTFQGHVIAIKPFGAIVQLVGTGVTGAVPIDSLPGTWAHEGHRLVGEDDSWAIGDSMNVRIDTVDEERGRIDLALDAPPKKKRRRRRRRKR